MLYYKNMKITTFKQKTTSLFQRIDDMSADDIEQIVRDHVLSCLPELCIIDIILSGSRCRHRETNNSDIDIILYYNGNEREDDLFNILHDEEITIDGIPVDINPISSKTTDIEYYLNGVERYLKEKD